MPCSLSTDNVHLKLAGYNHRISCPLLARYHGNATFPSSRIKQPKPLKYGTDRVSRNVRA